MYLAGASAATGGGNDGKDNMVEFPYSTLSLPPTVVAIPPPDGTLAPLVMVGCTATAAGRFGSVVVFAVVLAGLPYSKMAAFCSTAGSNSSEVCCSRVDCHRVIGFGSSCHTPLWFSFSSIWRCHSCWCYVWFVVVCAMSDLSDSLFLWRNDFSNWWCGKRSCHWQLLFFASFMLYKGIKKCIGRLYFYDCLFPKIDLSQSTYFMYHTWQS